MKYWLIKSEPNEYSIDDLANEAAQQTCWDGVRNYQARNFMRDTMNKGDLALFYHSNCKEPGIVGIVEICKEAYPDHTAFDPDDKHFDPKSDPENPRWCMVDVQFTRRLKRLVSLTELRSHSEKQLSDFALLRRGNRLSVLPVAEEHWKFILSLE
jgi:predicted RNA-binding protein with PUA-like domain